MNQDIAQ